jgi:hypothetical protein
MLSQMFYAPLEGDTGGGDDEDDIIVENADQANADKAGDTGDPGTGDTGEGTEGDGDNGDGSQDKFAQELAKIKVDLAKEKTRADQFESRYNETRTNYNTLSSQLRRDGNAPTAARPESSESSKPKENPWRKVHRIQNEYNASLDTDGQPTAESRKLALAYQDAEREAQKWDIHGDEGGRSQPKVDIRRELELHEYGRDPTNKEYPVTKLNEIFQQREMDLSEYKHQAEIRGAGGRAAYEESLMKRGEMRLAKDIREGKRQIKSINSISNNRSDGRKTRTPGKLDPNSPLWRRMTDAEMRAEKARATRRA